MHISVQPQKVALICRNARKCDVFVGKIGLGRRGTGPGRKKKAVAEERGGAGQAGERSPVERENLWQKSLSKGRLSLAVELTHCIFFICTH